MNLNYITFLIPILILVAITVWQLNKKENQFFSWVEDHWFFKKSKYPEFILSRYSLSIFCS